MGKSKFQKNILACAKKPVGNPRIRKNQIWKGMKIFLFFSFFFGGGGEFFRFSENFHNHLPDLEMFHLFYLELGSYSVLWVIIVHPYSPVFI